MTREPWGVTPGGEPVDLYTLTNSRGTVAAIATYGGTLVRLLHGSPPADIVLGFDDLAGYLRHRQYFGAVIGRCANRIANGRFHLNGIVYDVPANDGPHSLHGGNRGFDKRVWQARAGSSPDGEWLELSYVSADGEEGYPGTLSAIVCYTLLESDTLRVEYRATTTVDTVVNLTQHTYFNLAGHDSGSVLRQELTIAADRFTPIDAGKIPTGELRDVTGGPFDFRTPVAIGARLHEMDEQLQHGGGYDHNFALNGEAGVLRLAARAHDRSSGRRLEVRTTEPGLQLYAGQLLDGGDAGKGGVAYVAHQGFCLETQRFPNAINTPAFAAPILAARDTYEQITEFRLAQSFQMNG